jgi:hypothetical protein
MERVKVHTERASAGRRLNQVRATGRELLRRPRLGSRALCRCPPALVIRWSCSWSVFLRGTQVGQDAERQRRASQLLGG